MKQSYWKKAIANQPDIIIINSVLSGKQDIVQTIRFEKGLEMFYSLFTNNNF
jgi:hypothetical protein